jgi:Fe-S cluster biosynthesis and repair protein YggX
MKCLKCSKEFEESEIEDPSSLKYPSCGDCWKEWTTYGVMVINEMHLDMSLPEHRKALKKYERGFFGLDNVEELKKNPENPGTPS